MTARFLHIDGNTFYASVHRVFDPSLRRRPVIVLSNNDGCVVTRTAEAKAFGIGRGVPFFQIRGLAERHGAAVLSSNYELYQSMSDRMMAVIRTLVPRQEIYSIDEQFADVSGMENPTEIGREARARVLKWTGIPTCAGIAPTKTLAKLCDHFAKIYPGFDGVLNWDELAGSRQEKAFALTPVSEVWGVGARTAAKLADRRVETVLDFVRMPRAAAGSLGGVMLERTWLELQGEVCFPLEETPARRRQIVRSRSFSEPVSELESLLCAAAVRMDAAARAARREGSEATVAGVAFSTSPFRLDEPQHAVDVSMRLSSPTADTIELTEAAEALVRRSWKPGFRYCRLGVVLSDLVPAVEGTAPAPSLFCSPADEAQRARRRTLMQTADMITGRFGRDAIRTAACLQATGWEMKRERLTPCCTTSWDEMLQVD